MSECALFFNQLFYNLFLSYKINLESNEARVTHTCTVPINTFLLFYGLMRLKLSF